MIYRKVLKSEVPQTFFWIDLASELAFLLGMSDNRRLSCSGLHRLCKSSPRTNFHMREGSFPFPPRARCFLRGRPARPPMLQAKQSIPWYQPRIAACRAPRTFEIPKSLSVSLVVTPPRLHLPTLTSEIGELRQNWYPKNSAKFFGREN